ncbi:MAG: hypothetical protein HQL31_06530, partial [Planctomycetes bacterium]|nr:hypothetical protein [Planctomycetota bacterium]
NAGGAVSFVDGLGAGNLHCFTPGANLIFAAGQTCTVSGNLSLQGSGTAVVFVDSSDKTTPFELDISAGNMVVSYLYAGNSHASSNDIIALASVELGGTDSAEASPHWVFETNALIYTWTGVADAATWEHEGNWDGPPGYPDDSGDIALINNTAHSITTAANVTLTLGELRMESGFTGSVNTGGNLVTSTYVAMSGNVTVNAGILRHRDNSTEETYKLNLTVAGDMRVGISGDIDVTGRGYDINYGPGCPTGFIDGGSHGGVGGDYETDNNDGEVYGSITAPGNLGSGSNNSWGSGSAGGGAVRLIVDGVLELLGDILANGQTPGDTSSGSGGSIFITASAISGNGSICANGGVSNQRGSGAGGRVAVILSGAGSDFIAWSGVITAFGGVNTNSRAGAAGTVYTETAAQVSGRGNLIIDNNNNIVRSNTETLIQGGADLEVDDLILRNKAILSGNGISCATLSITGNSKLKHFDNSTAETYKLVVSCTNAIIDTASSIDVSGLGFDDGYGPGTPTGLADGGAYGGSGGDYTANGYDGKEYGSITAPGNLGSGADDWGAAGLGGGAVRLIASASLVLNGDILANGTVNGDTGGGSGGSVYITANAISGSGNLRANGANSGVRGGGGGGRIAVVLTGTGNEFGFYSGEITAYGGTSSSTQDGAAGTVYTETQAQGSGNGVLILDNNNTVFNSSHGVATHISMDVSGTDVGDVIIRNGAELRIEQASVSLTVSGNWTNSSNQILTAGNVVFDGTSAHVITSGGYSFFNAELSGNVSSTWTLVDAAVFTGNLTVSAGNLIQGAGNLSFDKLSLASGGYFQNNSSGAINVGSGGVVNDGTFCVNGGGSDCGVGADVMVRSSSTGVQRAWSGSGSFRMMDVDVKDQGGSAEIECFHSRNSGGNGSNWTIHNGCTGYIPRPFSNGYPYMF